MLPSLGLFKGFSCPFYNGVSSDGIPSCQRPYCHFRHVRKDEKLEVQNVDQVPEYKATPKLLSLPVVVKFRPKLEYQPEKPALNASPSKPSSTLDIKAPIYIPASCNIDNDVSLLSLSDCEDELNELSGIIEKEVLNDIKEDKVKVKTCPKVNNLKMRKEQPSNIDKNRTHHVGTECSKERRKSGCEIPNTANVSIVQQKCDSHSVGAESKVVQQNKSEDCFVQAHFKNKETNKSQKSKLDKDKNKNKYHKERKSDSSKSSTNKSSRSSVHTSKGSDKKYSGIGPSKISRNESSKSNMKMHSETTSLEVAKEISLRKNKNRNKADSKTFNTKEKSCLTNNEPVCANTNDDIMKECEMIYDQLEQEFASLHKEKEDKDKTNYSQPLKRKPSLDADHVASNTQKKRIAYENADKFKTESLSSLPKPNHIRNAMQAIFNRQATLHRKQAEEALQIEVAVREAEEKVRDATEALRKAKEKSHLTPLIPKSYLIPPARTVSRTIAPVANILALERAKKKVEELKAEKRQAFTPAQTIKGGLRLAHKTTTALNTKDTLKSIKPPVLEANSTKISFNVRMQYYEMMVKHCVMIYPNAVDAWERAQSEELTVFKKCNSVVIYKSSALLTINKLRKEAIDSGNESAGTNKMVSHEVILAGKLAKNNSWSMQKKMRSDLATGIEPFDKLSGDKAYDVVYELRLTEEQLVANGFPRPGKRSGTALISSAKPLRRPNVNERYCSRCGKVFDLTIYDEICVDECNYHPKSAGYRRGFADNHHRCCQQPAGTPGCTYANYHVTDYYNTENLTGYVTTIDKGDNFISTKKDIFALDCEMCYTTYGMELTRVTVVDINARTVYDTLVKPDNKIVDYNTVYSGITEQMLQNETRCLRDVQAILMSMFHSKSILVGHSLESDLKALKLIHSVVVDTSVLFPHKMGPPKKRALKTLCIENLKRIIQENEGGHDSAEDAEVCIHLVKFYLRNKIS